MKTKNYGYVRTSVYDIGYLINLSTNSNYFNPLAAELFILRHLPKASGRLIGLPQSKGYNGSKIK